MIKPSDLHTYFERVAIEENGSRIGTLLAEYTVRAYIDIRNLSEARSYVITCKQRIIIPHDGADALGGVVNAFEGYPVMLITRASLAPPPNAQLYLAEYSPKTLNSAVNSSEGTASSDGKTSSNSTQQTSGSSVSETNSYEVSASLGFFGEDLTGGVSFSYGHSDTSGSEWSGSSGQSAGRDAQRSRSDSDSMSIKDWSSFATLDDNNQVPSWVWSQGYPWSPIELQDVVNNMVKVPESIQFRLWDGKALVFPPSHLSLFGINFVCNARWIVTIPKNTDDTAGKVRFRHALEYFAGSHSIAVDDGAKNYLKVQLHDPTKFDHESDLIDLVTLGLDPVANAKASNGAVVGFVPSKFMASPNSASEGSFSIISGANNLYISGKGFTLPMATTFPGGSASLKIQFKILDDVDEYALYFKHWKGEGTGCMLSIVVNGDAANPIVKHVDSAEAEGGESNLTAITLRNKDYSSVEYHDYLRRGLNIVDITLTPAAGSNPKYCLRAIALGRA